MTLSKAKKIAIKSNKMIMKRCNYCFSEENLTIDHIIPKSQGGSDELKNLQCLCVKCNTMKSSFSHKQLQRLYNWLKECEIKRVVAEKLRLEQIMKQQLYTKQFIKGIIKDTIPDIITSKYDFLVFGNPPSLVQYQSLPWSFRIINRIQKQIFKIRLYTYWYYRLWTSNK